MLLHRFRPFPLVFLPLLSLPGAAADHFANATLLSGVFAQGSENSQTATTEAGEPINEGGGGPKFGYRSVWWKWTAPANGRLSLSTKGSEIFDKRITVVIGADVATARSIAFIGANSSQATDLSGLPVTAGVTYHIAIGGNNSGSYGTLSLALSLDTPGNLAGLSFPAPASAEIDSFAHRGELAGVSLSAIGYGNFANEEPFEPAAAGQGTLWWSWVAPTTGKVHLTTAGSDPAANKYLGVWTGSALPSLVPVVRSEFVKIPAVSFDSIAGQTYLFSIGTVYSAGHQYRVPGNIVLSLSAQPAAAQLQPLEVKRAVRLKWFAEAGRTYRLQSSVDLKFWLDVGETIEGDDTFRELYRLAEEPAGFFRLFTDAP